MMVRFLYVSYLINEKNKLTFVYFVFNSYSRIEIVRHDVVVIVNNFYNLIKKNFEITKKKDCSL